MLQAFVVYCIVATAAAYAVWHWMPTSARARAVSAVILLGQRFGLSQAAAARWQRRASTKVGCGDCGPCKACKPQTNPSRQS
jgi:type II secretory pathway pseudopilin PulG